MSCRGPYTVSHSTRSAIAVCFSTAPCKDLSVTNIHLSWTGFRFCPAIVAPGTCRYHPFIGEVGSIRLMPIQPSSISNKEREVKVLQGSLSFPIDYLEVP